MGMDWKAAWNKRQAGSAHRSSHIAFQSILTESQEQVSCEKVKIVGCQNMKILGKKTLSQSVPNMLLSLFQFQ